jgi:hypothetical protein
MLRVAGSFKLVVAPGSRKTNAPETAELARPHAVNVGLRDAVLARASIALEDLSQGTRTHSERIRRRMKGDPPGWGSICHTIVPCPRM